MYAVRCISGFPRFRAFGEEWPADRWVVVDGLPAEALSEKALKVVEVSGDSDPTLGAWPVEMRATGKPKPSAKASAKDG